MMDYGSIHEKPRDWRTNNNYQSHTLWGSRCDDRHTIADQVSLMFAVKRCGAMERPLGELAVGEIGHGCARLGVERETTVDQTLIRGLVTAFHVFSGLSSV